MGKQLMSESLYLDHPFHLNSLSLPFSSSSRFSLRNHHHRTYGTPAASAKIAAFDLVSDSFETREREKRKGDAFFPFFLIAAAKSKA